MECLIEEVKRRFREYIDRKWKEEKKSNINE